MFCSPALRTCPSSQLKNSEQQCEVQSEQV
jgi:hypothetical protein